MANKLAQEVEKLLSDILGEFIAKATVKKNCELIGTTPDTLTPQQLPELAEKIEKSVEFFAKDVTASDVKDKVRAIKV